MLATLPTPIFSRVAIAARQLLLPTLVLASAACSDNPTAPVRANPRPSFALSAPLPPGQILVTSGVSQNQLFAVDAVTTSVVQLTNVPGDPNVSKPLVPKPKP